MRRSIVFATVAAGGLALARVPVPQGNPATPTPLGTPAVGSGS